MDFKFERMIIVNEQMTYKVELTETYPDLLGSSEVKRLITIGKRVSYLCKLSNVIMHARVINIYLDNVFVRNEDDLSITDHKSTDLELVSADIPEPKEVSHKDLGIYLMLYPFPEAKSQIEWFNNWSDYHFNPLYFFLNGQVERLLNDNRFAWMKRAEEFPYFKLLFERFTGLILPNCCSSLELKKCLTTSDNPDEVYCEDNQMAFSL